MNLRRTLLFVIAASLSLSSLLFADTDAEPESPHKEKCYKCHDKDTAFQEWKLSAHAKSLTNLRKQKHVKDSCLTCHSSGVATQRNAWNSRSHTRITLEDALNEVSCSSCHLHSSKRKHYLIKSSLTLCISCHKMDCGCAGKGIIHQSQAEMYLGRKGLGVPSKPSPHRDAMKNDCVGCHMHKADAEEKTARVGGHTFKAGYAVCEPCHENVMERIEQDKQQVAKLLEEVNTVLNQMDDPDSPTYKTIQRNRDMVVKDGGYGIHNFAYAKELLRYGLTLVKQN